MTNQPTASGVPSPVENLQSQQCWELLRQVSVGRLAVWIDDHPDIFPLNYIVDHGSVVFRTGDGSKLSGALGETPVALEADGVDAASGVAWSVVVKGKAAALTRTEDILDSASLHLFPWQAGQKDHFVRITPDTITGRRFQVTPPLTWWTQLSGAVHTSPE
jgi:hypothetical protein